VKIRQRAFDSIRAHGAKGFPHEICGLLIGDPAEMLITEARPVRNIETQNPDVRYLIDDKEDMRIRKSLYKTDLDVLGYYHSHPNHPAAPSVFDTERSWESYVYVIVSVRDGNPADMNAFVAQSIRRPASATHSETGRASSRTTATRATALQPSPSSPCTVSSDPNTTKTPSFTTSTTSSLRCST